MYSSKFLSGLNRKSKRELIKSLLYCAGCAIKTADPTLCQDLVEVKVEELILDSENQVYGL